MRKSSNRTVLRRDPGPPDPGPPVEDSTGETDMNVVMTGAGKFVEIQGTAEGVPFSRADMDALIGLAEKGISALIGEQRKVLG